MDTTGEERAVVSEGSAESRCFALVFSLSVSVLLLAVMSRFFRFGLFWGVNHLSFFPLWVVAAVTSAGAVACIAAAVVRPRYPCQSAHAAVGDLRVRQIALGAALLSVLVFWFIRPATHLLGDQQLQITELAAGVVASRRAMGTVLLYTGVYRLLRAGFDAQVLTAYAFVGALCGGLFVYTLHRLVSLLGFRGHSRVLALTVVLAAGPTLFFFGYTENYTPLYLVTLAYLYFGLISLNRRKALVVPVGLLAMAVFFHQMAILLVPSLVVLLVSAISGHTRPTRRDLSVSLAILFAVMLVLYSVLKDAPLFSLIIPFFTNDAFPGYTLLSGAHLADLLNLLLLVAPGGFILFVGCLAGGSFGASSGHKFVLTAALLPFVLLLVSEPDLGVARDWDIFAFSGITLSVSAVTLLADLRRRGFRAYRSLLCAAVAASVIFVPWILVNTNEHLSVDRFQSILDSDPHERSYGYEILSQHYRSMKKYPLAIRALELASQLAPDNPRYHVMTADCYLSLGLRDSALHYQFKAIEADSSFWVAYFNAGLGLYQHGRLDEAFDNLMRAAQRMDHDSDEAWYNLGCVAFARGDEQLAFQIYREALRRNPHNAKANHNLSVLCYRKGDYTTAEYYHNTAKEYGYVAPPDYVHSLKRALEGLRPRQQ